MKRRRERHKARLNRSEEGTKKQPREKAEEGWRGGRRQRPSSYPDGCSTKARQRTKPLVALPALKRHLEVRRWIGPEYRVWWCSGLVVVHSTTLQDAFSTVACMEPPKPAETGVRTHAGRVRARRIGDAISDERYMGPYRARLRYF